MGKYIVQLDRDTCIGTHSCNLEAPEYFLPAEDGKIDLIRSVFNPENEQWELELVTDDVLNLINAADLCPVDAIVIHSIAQLSQKDV